MVLAVTYPWAPASSYLSSQSVADSRCHLYAAPRSSYPPRRSHSCRFFALKERKKTDNPREGWEDGTPPPHRVRDFKERGVWC